MEADIKYYSQNGQDAFLDHLLNGSENGVFLDIGAHDGIKYSNTCFFERHRNWSGLCIEANPLVYQKLKKNRKCETLSACITGYEGKELFMQLPGRSEMLSGLKNKFDSRHSFRVEKELAYYGEEARNIEVDCVSLNSIVKKYNLQFIDYCSIDTEGSELSILEGIDFGLVDISIFSVENTYTNPAIRLLLEKNGYVFAKRIGEDEIYLKKSELS